MTGIAEALTRLSYRLRSWEVLEQRGSIIVVRKKGCKMMCHGTGTIYSKEPAPADDGSYWTNSYWDLFMPLPGLYKKPRVLMIGLGGGTILRQLSAFYNGIELETVEIDGAVAELYSKHFGTGGAKVMIDDGADFVKHAKDRYDLMILDAFVGSQVPGSFLSKEFFADAYAALSGRGMLAINCMGDSRRIKKLAEGFLTYIIESPLSQGNSIILCSKSIKAAEIKAETSKGRQFSSMVSKAYAMIR